MRTYNEDKTEKLGITSPVKLLHKTAGNIFIHQLIVLLEPKSQSTKVLTE